VSAKAEPAGLSPEVLRQFFDLVQGSSRVLIGCHVNPDGDAIGSGLALAMAVEQLGAEAEVVCWHEPPANLRFLPGAQRIRRQASREADLAVIVDLESFSRLGGAADDFRNAPVLAVIDHHIPRDRPGDVRLIDQESASTAGILMDLFEAGPVQITAEIAECLLVGIVTDTGCFRHANTTPEVLRQAARLCELGADLSRVTDEVYQRRAEPAARLLGEALVQYKTALDGRLAWIALRADRLAELGATDEHTEGIVNELLAQEKVEAAFLLREMNSGRTKGSLRSRGSIDVAACAREFGGGGHRNAAGLVLDLTIDEAERSVLAAMQKCLASS
jgi:phosphoesterase RecJ-like protein